MYADWWLNLALDGAVLALPPPTDDIDPDAEYDKLAEFVREHLDMELVYRVMGLNR